MLSRTLRHIALLAFTACAVTTAACGLSIVGTVDATQTDGGVDAQVDHAAHLPGTDDGGDNEPPKKDGSVTDTGTDAVSPVDAADANETSTPVSCPEVSMGSTLAGTFNGHCYFVLTSGVMPVLGHGGAARTACSSANAHLVTITSVEEQTFVSLFDNQGNNSRWIGLVSTVDSDASADFTWVTGEPVTYENWNAGQPNADGLCGVMKDGDSTWQDRGCDDYDLAAICERE